jgi:hypothetical protein
MAQLLPVISRSDDQIRLNWIGDVDEESGVKMPAAVFVLSFLN